MKKSLKKIASPVSPTKGQELDYFKQLNRLGRGMMQAVKKELLPFLKANEEKYTMDGLGDELGVIFRRLNAQFAGTSTLGFSKATSETMVKRLEATNKSSFDSSIKKATGVDVGSVIKASNLEDFMKLNIQQNVLLIKSLPEEYFKQIEIIVNKGFTSGARYSTIFKEISSLHGSANSKLRSRMKTIARDQVSTINAQLTERRSSALGIKKGIFRTSGDEVVRKCHRELNGVEFVIAKGAWSKTCKKFIKPGITDINCRCTYSPVIDFGDEELTPSEQAPTQEGQKEAEEAVRIREANKALQGAKEAQKKAEEELKRMNVIPEVKGLSIAEFTKKNQMMLKAYKDLIELGQPKGFFEKSNDPLPAEVEEYTGNSDINYALRKADKFSDLKSSAQSEAKALDGFLDRKEIKSNVQLNRVLQFNSKASFDKVLNNYLSKRTFVEKGYTSTSAGELPEGFDESEYNIKIKIMASKETKGAFLPNHPHEETSIYGDNEFLLPRNTEFIRLSEEPAIEGKTATIILRPMN